MDNRKQWEVKTIKTTKQVWATSALVLLFLIAVNICSEAKAQTYVDETMGISWNRNVEPDMDHYNVYRSPTKNGFNLTEIWQEVEHPQDNEQPQAKFELQAPPVGKSFFAVTALDHSGNESVLSNKLQIIYCDDGVLPDGQGCIDNESPGSPIIGIFTP